MYVCAPKVLVSFKLSDGRPAFFYERASERAMGKVGISFAKGVLENYYYLLPVSG